MSACSGGGAEGPCTRSGGLGVEQRHQRRRTPTLTTAADAERHPLGRTRHVTHVYVCVTHTHECHTDGVRPLDPHRATRRAPPRAAPPALTGEVEMMRGTRAELAPMELWEWGRGV